MTSRDFAYWLQGFFEIQQPDSLDKEKIDMIQKHLNLVFVHEIDPSMGNKAEQGKLNSIHNTSSKLGQKLPGGAIARC